MNVLDDVLFHCPYCGEKQSIEIEHSLEAQSFIEDCAVCCRPISIAADTRQDPTTIEVYTENDATGNV